MRTDVKVGLVCVLILVIAVVAYFALQGKGSPAGAPANGHAKPAMAKTDVGAAAPQASIPGDITAPGAASPPVATPPVGYSQTPIVPGPLAQTPTPYSPPAASTTEPISGSPLYPGGAHPLLPPVAGNPGTVPPLNNNGMGERGGPTGPVMPSTPTTPSLGSEGHPGELTPSRDGSMLVPGPATPPTAHSHGAPLYPPLTNGESTAGDYTVVAGDNLTRIAKKNHTTVSALKAANPGINPNVLKVKQVLKLPGASVAETPAAPSAARPPHRAATKHGTASTGSVHSSSGRPASVAGGTYRVKKGDTLRKIAKSALGNEGLWRRIFRMNRGELGNPNDLRTGMVLKIPAH